MFLWNGRPDHHTSTYRLFPNRYVCVRGSSRRCETRAWGRVFSKVCSPSSEVQTAAVSTALVTTNAVAGPSRPTATAKRVAWVHMVPKNSKRIAHQLAPKRGGAVVPRKDHWEALNKWLEKPKKFKGTRSGPSHAVYDASPNQLRSLGIDPEVFNYLPREIRREQLCGAKIARETGVSPVLTKESTVQYIWSQCSMARETSHKAE